MHVSLAEIPDLPVCFEDDDLIVVDKPSGLLSQPGKTVNDSVATRVALARPDATGPLIVHRLDMDTSGLLLLAKNPDMHRAMARLFESRGVRKRYIAELVSPVDASGGLISLPIRRDYETRPRQLVCYTNGKPSVTAWYHAASTTRNGRLIKLIPLTGRTHQLRVHASHPLGLNNPIAGDRLYGVADNQRLMLHAEYLGFTHPVSGAPCELYSPASFA